MYMLLAMPATKQLHASDVRQTQYDDFLGQGHPPQ